ncbi:MAG: TIGR00366 family protein [Amaricoccus sp.]
MDVGGSPSAGRGKSSDNSSPNRSIADKFTEWSLNWVPEPMVFVTCLTMIVYLAALLLTDHGPLQLIDDYAQGFWVLLTFAMQLTVMMITGFVVADSKSVRRVIERIIGLTSGPKSTLLVFCMIVGAASWLHWAAGMMIAIVMGKEVAVRKRGIGLHYPILVAASYSMMLIMANGPSQSAPLLAATPGNFLEETLGGLIPLTRTALSHFLLVLVFFEFVTIPLILMYMMPPKERAIEISDEHYKEFSHVPVEEVVSDLRPAERWERSRILLTVLGAGMLIWVAQFLGKNGLGKIDLNVLNFTLFGLGLALHGSPFNFVRAVRNGIGTTYGVIIQFPMYAGIFGIIVHSGLSHIITDWFLSISTPRTYSWIVMVYTAIMDFFVPSGGSKFAIEAPFIIPAGQQLGIDTPHMINAYSTGGQLANLIQPFWALPFIAAYKIRFQAILPYTFVIFLYTFTVGSIAFLLFPHG